MANGNRAVSNTDIRDKLDSLRLEFKNDLAASLNALSQAQGRLEGKFDKLEAGRLTAVEGAVRDLKLSFEVYKTQTSGNEKTINNKFIAQWGILMLLLSSIFYWVIGKFFGGVH